MRLTEGVVVQPNSFKVRHIDRLDQIDHACIDALASWERLHRSRGGRVSIDWEELEFRSVNSNRLASVERLGPTGKGETKNGTRSHAQAG